MATPHFSKAEQIAAAVATIEWATKPRTLLASDIGEHNARWSALDSQRYRIGLTGDAARIMSKAKGLQPFNQFGECSMSFDGQEAVAEIHARLRKAYQEKHGVMWFIAHGATAWDAFVEWDRQRGKANIDEIAAVLEEEVA